MEKEIGPRSVSETPDRSVTAWAVEATSVQHVLLETTFPPSSWMLHAHTSHLTPAWPLRLPTHLEETLGIKAASTLCMHQTYRKSPRRLSQRLSADTEQDASSKVTLLHHQPASPAGDKLELGPPIHVCHCCPVVVTRVKCETTGRHATVLHVPLAPALQQTFFIESPGARCIKHQASLRQ